jgi:hypothetical protein
MDHECHIKQVWNEEQQDAEQFYEFRVVYFHGLLRRKTIDLGGKVVYCKRDCCNPKTENVGEAAEASLYKLISILCVIVHNNSLQTPHNSVIIWGLYPQTRRDYHSLRADACYLGTTAGLRH